MKTIDAEGPEIWEGYIYTWCGKHSGTADPEGLPVIDGLHSSNRIFLDGQDVTGLRIYRAKTGYHGWVEFYLTESEYTHNFIADYRGKDAIAMSEGNFVRIKVCGRVEIQGPYQIARAKILAIQGKVLGRHPNQEQGEAIEYCRNEKGYEGGSDEIST